MVEITDLTGPDSDAESGVDAGDTTMYWEGAVRLIRGPEEGAANSTSNSSSTSNNGDENDNNKHDNRISFQDLLQPLHLQKCLLSSYVIDREWLLQQLLHVPQVILVQHGDERAQQPKVHSAGKVTTVTPAFARFPAYGVMHSKIMLLWYNERLRVVVSTANLVPYDYDEVQNMVFVQDIPRAEHKESTAEFSADLVRLVRTMGVHVGLVDTAELTMYDYASVGARLVYSLPGMANADVASGLAMLARRVPTLDVQLECQGSSLGAMDDGWLRDVLACAGARLPVAQAKKRPAEQQRIQGIKIVFPTMEHAMHSPHGPGAFGTIFCQEKFWSTPSAPRHLFHRCESARGDSKPLHTKVICAMGADGPAWYYVGSHNFTPSAWGKFVKEKGAVMIANYELGVILPAADTGFPFPYKRPVDAYGEDDEPWIQSRLFG